MPHGRDALVVSALALSLVGVLALPIPAWPEPGVDAKAIVDRVDRLLRGDSSEGEIAMSVVTRRWTRTLTMRVWSEGTDKALIKVTAPAKEAGTATLKTGNDIWNYLPKIDRTIRVPTSMMMASWMGSHFTNDDLVKESRLIRDYDIEVGFTGARDGVEVWEFVLTPRPEAAVVWGQNPPPGAPEGSHADRGKVLWRRREPQAHVDVFRLPSHGRAAGAHDHRCGAR